MIRIESDGYASSTKITDAKTGKVIRGVRRVKVICEADRAGGMVQAEGTFVMPMIDGVFRPVVDVEHLRMVAEAAGHCLVPNARPGVGRFAALMQHAHNDEDIPRRPIELLRALLVDVVKLQDAVYAGDDDKTTKQCADVANMAMRSVNAVKGV